MTPQQILDQQRRLRAEHKRVLKNQGPVSMEESLEQVRASLATAKIAKPN